MPRLISASASSFSHLPSCTTKLTNSRLGNQQSATERVKHSKGSFKLRTSSLDAAIDSSSFFLIRLSDVMTWFLSLGCMSDCRLSRNLLKVVNLLDLEWRGVGFLDLAIFLWVFWNAIATSNINSGWKHPIHLWKPCKLKHYRPSVCYVLVLTKEQGKETRALQEKILPRLLTTIWQRKDVWKTLFQNKSGGTINPVYLPQTTPEQYKESVNQKTLSISVYHKSCPIFLSCNLGGASHEQL